MAVIIIAAILISSGHSNSNNGSYPQQVSGQSSRNIENATDSTQQSQSNVYNFAATAAPTQNNYSETAPTARTLTASTVDKGIVAAGNDFTIVLNSDGTVTKIGGNSSINTSGWSNVTQISAYEDHTAGLCSNGGLVFTGNNEDNAGNISGWSNIK